MRSEAVNYETLSRITDAITSKRKWYEVAEKIVTDLTEIFGLKGSALMLLDQKTNELKVLAAHGLSQRYLDKGPVSSAKSIAASLNEGPVAIFDVGDDPRLQYPEEAISEGIKSILSVPIVLREKPFGVLRLYTAEPWEFRERDIIFFQAFSLIIAFAIDSVRVYKGLKSSIEILKLRQAPKVPGADTFYE